MLLSRVLFRAFSLALVLGSTACLRAQDPPESWPCFADSDCESGQACYRSADGAQTCQSKRYCEADSECSELEVCTEHSCATVECKEHAADACSPFTCSGTVCLTACQSSADCVGGRVCDQGNCVPTECSISAGQDCAGFACVGGLCLDACEDASDCASGYHCKEGSCAPIPKADGESCEVDAGCLSWHCCPTDATDTYECASSCSLRAEGEACQWDRICGSASCDGGVCVPCEDEECRAIVCAALECGTIQGVNCGDCAKSEFCSPAGQCVTACVEQGCGTDHGVECGTCDNETYCGEDLDCHPWTECAPGTKISADPSATEDRTCDKCIGGYSSKTNASSCKSWTECAGIEDVPPSTTTDRVCHPGWNRTYGTMQFSQQGLSLELIAGGDAVVGGYVAEQDDTSPSDTNRYAYVRRIDSADGDIVWEQLLGTDSFNRVVSLVADSSGNVYAAGTATSNVGGGAHLGDGDAFVRKLAAADGAPSWTKSLGTTAQEEATSVSVAPDGHVLVAGLTRGALAGALSVQGATDTFAFKLSSIDGSVLWQTQFGQSHEAGIAADSEGNVVVVSNADVAGTAPEGAGRFTVSKLSGATGAELWTRRMGHHGLDFAKFVAVDGDGAIFVAGSYDGMPSVMKLDGDDGTRRWVVAVESATMEAPILSLTVTASGAVLLSGETRVDLDREGVVAGAYALELDGDDGSTRWVEQFGVEFREYAHGVGMDDAGDIWIAGTRVIDRDDPPDTTQYNSFVAKIIRESAAGSRRPLARSYQRWVE